MPILELREVAKHFGGLPAVDGVDLEVDEGVIFALIGPNGAGKSTLLKTVSGMHEPTAGSVVFDGRQIGGRPVHEIRARGVAKVLQHPRVFPSMTVRDNVALGAMFGTPGGRRAEQDALGEADEALDLVGLQDHAGSHVGELNLHEQRILDLARAVAGRPRLLLLDEVMAGLNPSELAASIDVVRRVRDTGVTVLWVEHVMRAVTELAEHVAVLNFGRLIAEGSPDEVMRDREVVEAYLGAAAPDDEGEPDAAGR